MEYHLVEIIFSGIIGIGLIVFIIRYIKNTTKALYAHLEKKYDTEIAKIKICARDSFYDMLIMQEHPIWFRKISDGKLIEQSEIDYLIHRRGFNEVEAKSLQSMADFMNANHKLIKQINQLTPKSK